MSNANDFIESFRITNQNPLDAKTYKESEEALKDLGSSNNLAYTYGQGLLVYCVAEGTRWEWREPDGVEVGLLDENFVYPNGFTADYKDYSNKAFNFFIVQPSSTDFQKATANISGVVKTDVSVSNPIVYLKESVDTLLLNKVTKLPPITAGVKTKISYNADGLVISGTDATTGDILSVSDSRYVTDADLVKLSNTSGVNTGDNANNTTSNAYADSKIENQLVAGVTTKGASQAIIYTNLLLKENISNKGIADGYVPLDSNTKIPLIYINDALLGNVQYQGLWNQGTNIPNLDIVKPKGHYYICSGLTEITRYGLIFNTGDWIISNGITWDKVDNTDAVSSIFGRTGNISAQIGDYTTALVTETINKNYQTDNQKLFNDATSSIQTQLNTLTLADFTSTEKTNILSQYNDTDVNYPAYITWRPGKITEQNELFKIDFSIDDLLRDKISKMKPYYCNYDTGSNSNDGLTPATAVKTITYAYSTLGARLLYLTGGIHKSDSWGSLNATFTNTDDFFVLNYGDKKTYITNAPATNPTYSLQSGTTYQYTLAATVNVVDMKYKDKKGFPFRMTLQTSIALVNSNLGSFYVSGTTVYINTLDGRVPDADVLSLRNGLDTATYNANAGYHYVRDITFMGGSVENGTHGVNSQTGSSSTLVSLGKNCKFLYGNGASYTSNGGEGTRNRYNKFLIHEDCIAYGNARDGFNYLADAGNKIYVLEVDCQAFQNGERLLSSSVNASSLHGVGEIIRLNCKGYNNSGPNFVDVDGVIAANFGVTAFNSISTVANDKADFTTNTNTGVPSRQYNYKCRSYNSTTAFRVGGSQESHIINKDCFYKGSVVIGNPSAPQTVTFGSFPTANVISPILPSLSAYIPNAQIETLLGFTVATLPIGVLGDLAYVIDALAPTYNTTVVGGGAVRIPVFFDGTAWKTH